MVRAGVLLALLGGLAGCSASGDRGSEMHDQRSAATNFAVNCQGCHLPDGSGMAGKVPDMRGMLGRIEKLPGGRAYLVRVPGVSNSALDDRQTAEVLNWLIRSLGPVDPAFVPYDAAEVHRWRSVKLLDPASERARILTQ